MTVQIDYIAEAKKTLGGIPAYPDSTNSFETQLINIDSQAQFNQIWEDSKERYRQYQNDRVGLSGARRGLALLLTKAQSEGWLVDGKPV